MYLIRVQLEPNCNWTARPSFENHESSIESLRDILEHKAKQHGATVLIGSPLDLSWDAPIDIVDPLC